MHKYIIILTLLFALYLPVHAQENTCKADFTQLDVSMDVDEFFEKQFLAKDLNQYLTKSGTPINATSAFKSYNSTYNISRRMLTKQDLNTNHPDDEQITIGKLYNYKRYTEEDHTICYGNLWFYTFQMVATNHNQFVALTAENRKVTEVDFLKLLHGMELQYKLEQTDTKNFTLYTYKLEKYVVQFKKAKKSFRNESSIAMPGAEPAKPTVDITLLIWAKTADENHLKWLNQNNSN